MAAYTAEAYRQPLFRPADDLFARCLTASSILGALLLIAIFLAPAREIAAPHVTKLPKRLARLILEKPKPVAPVEQAAPEVKAAEEIVEPVVPEPERPRQRREEPRVDPDAGQLGRQRAQTVRQELQSTSAALQSSLQDLSTSLRSTKSETEQPARARRSRSVRAGRSSGDLSRVETNVSGGNADLAGSAVTSSNVVVGSITAGGSDGGAASPSASGSSASASGASRSNASLLAVIQKYSAGIQYCYANELKHNESLRGKLVVAITVAPSGAVTDAAVVENTLGSQRLADCALSQIREWKFPSAAGGSITFQAPFVFTPPK